MYIFFIYKKQGNVHWSYIIIPMNYWKFWFLKFLIFQKFIRNPILLGFPGGLKGKASAYNAGDPGSIPESGRSPGEGNGTPIQYSCLENPMDGGAWEAAVHGVAKSQTRLNGFTFTFHFDALEEEMATHSSVLAWRIPGTGEPGGLLSMGSHRVGHDWSDLAAAATAYTVGGNAKWCRCYVEHHECSLEN